MCLWILDELSVGHFSKNFELKGQLTHHMGKIVCKWFPDDRFMVLIFPKYARGACNLQISFLYQHHFWVSRLENYGNRAENDDD